jgi:hypothetical protein
MSIPIMSMPTPTEFARLERTERLHVLAVAQAEYGVDDSRYRALAGIHFKKIRDGDR